MNDLDKLFGEGFESAGSVPTTANPSSSGTLPLLLLVIGSCILIGLVFSRIEYGAKEVEDQGGKRL